MRIIQFIMVNGLYPHINVMVEVFKYGKMVLVMKVIGKMIKLI